MIFEGRDSAGKGGRHQAHHPAPQPTRLRVAALPAPNERERTQWYFQRYVAHFGGAGEIVLFDRSWYNRAGVERVMGFCTEGDVEEFFRSVPEFERMLVRSGIVLLKYWFSITDEEQALRFNMRIMDPLKQWKLSPMVSNRDGAGRITPAPRKTCSPARISPRRLGGWSRAVDKNAARLNCISLSREQIPYGDVEHPPVHLPARVRHADYIRARSLLRCTCRIATDGRADRGWRWRLHGV